VRPKPGAPVSTPLHWDELKHGIVPRDFTMDVALKRCAEHGDLFAPVLEDPRPLAAAARALAELG
jgi:bifunctional non-homologous end joining protein LigD